MIPGHLIDHRSAKQGLADAVESVWVRHRSGGTSIVGFKSYDQRREAFQGTAQHVIWLDEEPPEDILTESILRTAETTDFPGGMVMLTFTPIQGLTPLILSFLPGGHLTVPADGNVVFCDWSEIPHLSEQEKADLIARIPAYQRDARTKGIPALGSGVPVPESDIRVQDFELPKHWPRGFAWTPAGIRRCHLGCARSRKPGHLRLQCVQARSDRGCGPRSRHPRTRGLDSRCGRCCRDQHQRRTAVPQHLP